MERRSIFSSSRIHIKFVGTFTEQFIGLQESRKLSKEEANLSLQLFIQYIDDTVSFIPLFFFS